METEWELSDKAVSCCYTVSSVRSWVVCLSPIMASYCIFKIIYHLLHIQITSADIDFYAPNMFPIQWDEAKLEGGMVRSNFQDDQLSKDWLGA